MMDTEEEFRFKLTAYQIANLHKVIELIMDSGRFEALHTGDWVAELRYMLEERINECVDFPEPNEVYEPSGSLFKALKAAEDGLRDAIGLIEHKGANAKYQKRCLEEIRMVRRG